MIPPAPADLLSSNPQFAKLHQTLTTKILDPDGSTRATNNTYITTTTQLHKQRVALAKDRILLSTLSALTTDEHLPESLRDLIALITAYIPQATALSQDDHALLAPSLRSFQRQLPLITRSLAAQLVDQERTLTSAAAVAALHRDSTSTTGTSSASSMTAGSGSGPANLNALGPLLTSQTAHLTHLRTHTVPRALTQSTDALTALLRARTAQIRRAILGLERRKHGAGARYVLSRAAFLAAVAETLRGKVRVEGLEVWGDGTGGEGGGTGDGGIGERVKRRVQAWGEEMGVLEGRRRELEGALGEYEEVQQQQGQGGGDVMRRLGKRYREVEEEIAEVKSDVERLKRQMEEARGPRRRG